MQVIMNYLMDKFPEETRDLMPKTPEARAKAQIPVRLMDVYITPIQASLSVLRATGIGA